MGRNSWLHLALLLALLAGVVAGVPTTAASASPSAVDVRVGSSSDDAEENRSGQIDLTSTDLELIQVGANPQVVGMRFAGVQVPPGATIANAYVQFTVDEVDTDPADLVVRAEAAADPAPFTSADDNISSRPVTAASAAWAPPPWDTIGAAGPEQRTSDLSAVVQEVVSGPGWAAGNAIVLILTGSGERTAESFDGDAAAAPVLHVEYTDTANTAPDVSITSPSDGSRLPDDEDVLLSGSATDAEDGDISGAISWSSDRVGDLGVGASVTARLPVGTHVVTATVADSGGARASTSVSVTMTGADPILVGAGDISRCNNDFDAATAELILDLPQATVFTAGDNAYGDGSPEEFAQCYDPTWGQFKDRTRPAVGNHEYRTPGASGYFDYFGASAGDPATGYYSYDLGTWHVVVLNSNCSEVGGCDESSPQGQWLAADLAASTAACTVAYWHHSRFSSGSSHGSDAKYADFWKLLDDAGTALVLSGHDHHYERFARQDSDGNADPDGMRQFVVGTGGTWLRSLGAVEPNSEYANVSAHGVLALTLRDGTYDWEFRSVPDGVALDSGSDTCGGGAPGPPDPPADASPTVSISSPADGETFADTEPVTFTAAADDPEDGDIAGSLQWTSSIDGPIGNGRSITTDALSAGDHVVTAEVTDAAGNTASASVSVTIEPGEPPANSLAQTAFRVRTDDGTPLDADDSWASALNTGAGADMEERFRIRFEVAETAGTRFSGSFALQYRRNGGAWSDVPVAPDDGSARAVSEVEIWDSAFYRDADPTGDVLQRSTLPFEAGYGLERGVTPRMTLDSQHTELEWALKIRKFHEDGVNAEGDRFEFRVVQEGGEPLGVYASPAVVSLVHPPGLIGGTHIENPNRIGPFADSNGNLYYVAEPTEYDNQMMMLKSTDGGATWLEVDRADRPATNDLEGVDIRQVDDTLHIAHHPGGEVVYHTFHMSGSPTTPDNWGVRDEVVDSGFDEPDQATAIEVLSDGRVRVFYGVAGSSNDEIRYKTRSAAGSWDSAPSVLDGERVDWHWVTTVRADEGTNRDRIFVFSFEDTTGRAYLRTLDPDGTLSDRTPLQTLATGSSHRQPILPPVYWNDGEDRVLVAYKKADDTLHSRVISGTSVGPEVRASDQQADRHRGASRQPVADLVAHDAAAHLLYADAATFDLWTDSTGTGDGTWGTDTEVIDDVRVNWVRGSVFEHAAANGGGTVYGFAYEDHDTDVAGFATGYIRYAELPLGSPSPSPSPTPSAPPVADAGPDQTVADSDRDGAEEVQLDASGSVPGDGAITRYEWFDGGTKIATGATPAVRLDVGSHLLTVKVTDSNGLSDSDTVTVTVTVGSIAPISYVSFESSTDVPGIGTVNDLDIVAFDHATGRWSMYFDASDLGMTSSDLSAFHLRGDGSVLMSVSADDFAVPGLTGGPSGELVDDSDVFVFTPTSVGETTAGSFAFHFDGSDVGFRASGEDIDALYEFSDGSLGVSTVRTVDPAVVADADDEDILRFAGTFGATTAGTWTKYFDGGDGGVSPYGKDVDAISFDGADLLFSTTETTDSNDIIRYSGSFEPGTSGTTALEFDPSDHGIGGSADVDGLHHRG